MLSEQDAKGFMLFIFYYQQYTMWGAILKLIGTFFED